MNGQEIDIVIRVGKKDELRLIGCVESERIGGRRVFSIRQTSGSRTFMKRM